MSGHILIVDDDAAIRELLARALESHGYSVHGVPDGRAGLRLLSAHPKPDLAIVNLEMPKLKGTEVVKEARAKGLSLPIIILTGHGTIPVAVEAIQSGADDFLTKPFEIPELLKAVEKTLKQRAMELENIALRRELEALGRAGDKFVIGRSAAMTQVWGLVEKVADTSATVLILGESGTGKGVLARTIHRLSERSQEPFVALSCAALPETLLESELFGHEKGAFTGADSRKPGRFELVGQGTLFLDEVGDLPLALQAKLLRVLQEGDFEPLGSTRTHRSGARVLAATNRDLAAAVEGGEFREDLYYRLNVITLPVPPLRDRPEDIPLLADHFVRQYADLHGRTVVEIAPEAMSRMAAYRWPGNVRELENLIERAVVLAHRSTLSVDDLPPALGGTPPDPERITVTVGTSVDEAERELIHATLHHTEGDRAAAAAILGISVRTLYRRLAEDPGPDDLREDLQDDPPDDLRQETA